MKASLLVVLWGASVLAGIVWIWFGLHQIHPGLGDAFAGLGMLFGALCATPWLADELQRVVTDKARSRDP